jgi:hypothetical protein
VPHLRGSAVLCTTYPALTHWAKVCRASGAPRFYVPRTQRLRAGLKYAAPTALEETQILAFSSQRLRAGLKYAAPPVLRGFMYHVPSAHALG